MKNTKLTSMGKKTAHLLSRNLLSTAAVIALMGAATFAAAPAGGYLPGATLDPDCAPSDTDCIVQSVDNFKFVDGTDPLDASYMVGNVGIGTSAPDAELDVVGTIRSTSLRVTNEDINGWPASFSLNSTSSARGVNLVNRDESGSSLSGYRYSLLNNEGASRAAGAVNVGKENLWTNSSSTTNSFMSFFNTKAGGWYERMRIASNGNVGIGTTTPTEKLDVVGNIKASGTVCDTNGCIGDSADGKFVDGTVATNAVYTGGSVGIGTNSPEHKLDVYGAIRTYSGPGNKYGGLMKPKWSTPYGKSMTFVAGPTDVPADQSFHFEGATGTHYMAIKQNGNVGIGTTAPTKKLQIEGSTGDNPSLLIHNTGTGTGDYARLMLKTGAFANSFQVYAKNGTMRFGRDGIGDDMTINGTGNVGIGTIAPSEKLDVNGTTKTTKLTIPTGTNSWSLKSGGTNSLAFSMDGVTDKMVLSGIFDSTTSKMALRVGEYHTLSYPQFSFMDDGNTGIAGGNTADTIHVITGGAARITANQDGNVGIGTTSPESKLDVSGLVRSDNITSFFLYSTTPDSTLKRMKIKWTGAVDRKYKFWVDGTNTTSWQFVKQNAEVINPGWDEYYNIGLTEATALESTGDVGILYFDTGTNEFTFTKSANASPILHFAYNKVIPTVIGDFATCEGCEIQK